MTGAESPITAAAGAYVELGAAEDKLSAETTKLAHLVRLQRGDREARAKLLAADEAAAALRTLDGPESAPKDPDRTRSLARMAEEIPVRETAIVLQRQRIADATSAVERIRPRIVGAVIAMANMLQASGANEVHAALIAMVPALSKLVAADQIQCATIGDRVALPAGSIAPFSGAIVAANFARAVPECLRPDALMPDVIADAALHISTPLIAAIRGV